VTVAPERPRTWASVDPSVLRGAPIYEETRIPYPIPTILEVSDEARASDDILTVNFGPNHPSTHGVLRLIVDLDGETVVGVRAVIGYLHPGFEKNMEAKTWWKAITYGPRIDYVSFQNNELVFVLAIEQLLQLGTPEKAVWMRMLLAELNRIHSHLVWLGTSGLELGAISMFWYCFRERDQILDLFEMSGGQRMHTRYFQVGGVFEDIPVGFEQKLRQFCAVMPSRIDQYEALLDRNEIFLRRTKDVGVVSRERLLELGVTGPLLRAAGEPWDLRKSPGYLSYGDFDFKIPVGTVGDGYDRYRVRIAEMRESVRIIEQAIDGLPEGPWVADDRKVVLPPRHELGTSMEALIHHFKLVTEGFRVPPGEVYFPVEGPRGEYAVFLVADGSSKPVRVHMRDPSFVNLQALREMCVGGYVADLIANLAMLDPILGGIDR
jgi:NADH-quinone oxidoreductase subunit D